MTLPPIWFDYIDHVGTVVDEAAFEHARTGLLIGPNSAAAFEIADEYSVDREAVVLRMVCDSGDRYFDVLSGAEYAHLLLIGVVSLYGIANRES